MLTYDYYRNNPEEFKKYRCKDQVPLNCCSCTELYYRVQRYARTYKYIEKNFCSKQCQSNNQVTSVIRLCGFCTQPVTRRRAEYTSAKKNIFCNSSCAAKYNNAHKTTGNRRSKLEAYLEEQLRIIYPDLKIIANGKEVIHSELDFYFPELRFAIELNGIFHYEPIYGQDKLEKIQDNDKQKLIKCYEAGIELMILDASIQKRFTVQSSNRFLDIIKEQIDSIMKRKEPT